LKPLITNVFVFKILSAKLSFSSVVYLKYNKLNA
jgi:hypothetical protein